MLVTNARLADDKVSFGILKGSLPHALKQVEVIAADKNCLGETKREVYFRSQGFER